MNCPGYEAKADNVHTSMHYFLWILLKFLWINKLPASLSDFNSVKAVHREAYGNTIWSKSRNKRPYFSLSAEESSKPLGHKVETTVRTVKPFLELKDQKESKKHEENELLNRVYLKRDLIKGDKLCMSLSRHSSTHLEQGLRTGAVPVLDSTGAAFPPLGTSVFPTCKMVMTPY